MSNLLPLKHKTARHSALANSALCPRRRVQQCMCWVYVQETEVRLLERALCCATPQRALCCATPTSCTHPSNIKHTFHPPFPTNPHTHQVNSGNTPSAASPMVSPRTSYPPTPPTRAQQVAQSALAASAASSLARAAPAAPTTTGAEERVIAPHIHMHIFAIHMQIFAIHIYACI